MSSQGNARNLNQEFNRLHARIDQAEREKAHWKAMALENQQILSTEQQARQETERALHNAEFLAKASALVSGAFDYAPNLDQLVRFVADEFADWTAIDLLTEDSDKLVRFAVASKDPGQEELLRDSYNYYPLNLDGPHPIAQALREKKTLLVKNAGQIPTTGDLNPPNLTKDPGKSPSNQSYLVVPLQAGNDLLGVFIFVRLTGNQPFEEADQTLAEDLTGKVALMIQNSRLYEKLEKALENQQELNYYKDLYLSILSHELRNPLASIRGYTQVIWRNLIARQKSAFASTDILENHETASKANPDTSVKNEADFEKEFRSLNILINQSDRMNRMVNELLDFSRIQKNNFELNYLTTVDLVELIQKIVEEQAIVVKTHQFEIETNQPEIKGIFDENRLEQVFNNLISNAVKYSPHKSTVKITLTLKPTDSVMEDASDCVLIAIKDEGQGIDKEAQEKLFEKYYRVRTEKNRMVQGLGLGLYICKEIVRQHHGELWVESEVDKGSTFYVNLPLKPPRTAI